MPAAPYGARIALLAVVAAVGLTACGRPAPTLRADDRPRTDARRLSDDPRDKADALLRDMAQYLYAAEGELTTSPAQVRVITLGPFVNRTNLPASKFARFRADFQNILKQRSRPYGLLFADEGPQAGPSRYELRAAALSIGDAKDAILLRLALVGPARSGQPAPIWSDAITLPAP